MIKESQPPFEFTIKMSKYEKKGNRYIYQHAYNLKSKCNLGNDFKWRKH